MTAMTEDEFKQFKTEFREFMRLQIIDIRNKMPTPDGKEFSQQQMADALGITKDAYRQYESEGKTRNSFPFALLSRFCEVTGHDPWTVLTEQGAGLAPGKRQSQ